MSDTPRTDAFFAEGQRTVSATREFVGSIEVYAEAKRKLAVETLQEILELAEPEYDVCDNADGTLADRPNLAMRIGMLAADAITALAAHSVAQEPE